MNPLGPADAKEPHPSGIPYSARYLHDQAGQSGRARFTPLTNLYNARLRWLAGPRQGMWRGLVGPAVAADRSRPLWIDVDGNANLPVEHGEDLHQPIHGEPTETRVPDA